MGDVTIGGRPRDIERVEALGSARMATYLRETGYHAGRALSLYSWNQRVAAEFWPLISLTEVTLRNALDEHIGAWCAGNGGNRDWLLDPLALPPIVKKEFGGKLNYFLTKAEEAKKTRDRGSGLQRSTPHPRAGEPLNNDDVLAQITLGEWNHFIPGVHNSPDPTTYHRRLTLWTSAAAGAFPSIEDPTQLHFPLHRAHQFRNRVAHHEPIFSINLPSQRRDFLAVLRATNADIAEWFLGSDPLPGILREDPRL